MIRTILGALTVATAVAIWLVALAAAVFAAFGLAATESPEFALLRIEGTIASGEGLAAGTGLPSALAALRDLERSATTRALVLRVDSPGGTPASSDELHRAVLRVRESGKTVVVSMGDACASGGYYVACAGERLFASASTVTGSIGVISEFPVVAGIAEKLGVEMQTVKSAEYKDIGTMYRRPTDPERAHLQAVVDEMHRGFVEVVASSRGRATAEVAAIADGRYFTGTRALELGLIDEIGGLREATDAARALAGLPADADPVEVGSGGSLLRSLLTLSLRSAADRLLAAPAAVRPRL